MLNDRFYFRKLSKAISSVELLKHGAKVLKLEGNIYLVNIFWSYTTNSVDISKWWIAYHHFIEAASKMEGYNAHLKNRDGFHFVIRMIFMAN